MQPLFIVGVGRSGTSLLQSMFAAHPRVAMLPETGFFRRYCVPVRGRGVPAEDLEALRAGDERLQRIDEPCWNATISAYKARSDDRHDEKSSAVRLYRELLFHGAPCGTSYAAEHIRLVGDKDPRLIEYLPLLHTMFPESYVIHIIRDPRDVLLSKTRAEWSGRRDWRLNLLASRFQLDLGERWGPRLFGEHYQRVWYEELITDPETVLGKLTARCGLQFDAHMLSFSEAAARLGNGKTEKWKQETLGPLLPANTGKWRDGLTPRQIGATEGACAPWFQRLYYRRSLARSITAAWYRALLAVLSPMYRVLRTLALFVARMRAAL